MLATDPRPWLISFWLEIERCGVMATFAGLFVKNRAETAVVITKTPPMILSKSRDLCLPAFAVVRPDAIQFVLVNSAVFGYLQLLLDPMHKFPHRPDNWFDRFYPASLLSMAMRSRFPSQSARYARPKQLKSPRLLSNRRNGLRFCARGDRNSLLEGRQLTNEYVGA